MKRHGYVVKIAAGRWGSFDATGRLVRVFRTWGYAYSHAYCYTTGRTLYSDLRRLDAWHMEHADSGAVDDAVLIGIGVALAVLLVLLGAGGVL